MNNFILHHEAAIRLGFFFGLLVLMAAWEVLAPRRVLSTPKSARWVTNLSIVVLNTLLLRLLLPAAAVGVAALATQRHWGVFNNLSLSDWLIIAMSVVALDLTIYLQHVLFHAVPILWRIHRIHHTDLDFDVTTGVRFHPLEIILSLLIKFSAILVLGTPVMAVLIFEVLLNATSMFNHGNVRLPAVLDRVLRWIVVTPDMHRVHHSVEDDETNSNFGFNLPWWDRLFGSYRAQPRAGHEGMIIGIRGFRNPTHLTLPWLLIQPFIGKITGYAINRRQW